MNAHVVSLTMAPCTWDACVDNMEDLLDMRTRVIILKLNEQRQVSWDGTSRTATGARGLNARHDIDLAATHLCLVGIISCQAC